MNSPEHLPVPNDASGARLPARWGRPRELALSQAGPAAPRPDEDVIDLRALWQVLVRRRAIIFSTLILTTLLAVVATFVMTPIYRSTLMLQIETEGQQKVVDYGSVKREETAGYWGNQDFYRTQYELLKSRALARRVIDQLGLQVTEDKPRRWAFLSEAVAQLKTWAKSLAGVEPETAGLAGIGPEAIANQQAEEALMGGETVEPLRDSRLVRIHYDSPDPAEAVEILNAIANNFINLNLERRFEASSYAKRFLTEQLDQARATLEDAEKRFVAYAREREIVDTDNRLDITLEKLREMNKQLVNAQAARIAAEAEYQALVDSGAATAQGALDNAVVQTLKERRAELEKTYDENRKLFKPRYPKMQELVQQIEGLNQQIARETGLIAAAVKSKYEAKAREEAKLMQTILGLKEETLALQDRSTDYETLKREVQTSRQLYDGLLQRMKEVGVAAGVGDNNIAVVDPATVPTGPYKPNLKLNLAVAIALGLFLGGVLAFLLEGLDDTIKTADEVEALVNAPMLGLMPTVYAREAGLADHQLGLLVSKAPQGPIAEAARSLRTQLLFSSSDGAPNILHYTSTSAGEGKTTTAVATAIAFAQAGSKVLIIDGDLRSPSLHQVFSLPNSTGLTNYLAGGMEPLEISQGTPVPLLFSITSGPLPPNPVELLSSARMLDLLALATERFDIVIVDGPPVIGLADALVLSNLAKATIFVVDLEKTRRREIQGAVKRLALANAHLVGTVLSKVRANGKGYGYGYGYGYGHLYGYGNNASNELLPNPDTA